MTKIKAVIFDMDGVLIDAKDWHYEALNRALNHFGYNISRYDHLVTFDGLPTRKKLEMLTREHGLPPALHGFLNELVHARCKPLFQHEFALSNLRAAGMKLAVASNSVRPSIELMMLKSNLSGYLDAMVSNQEVKTGKPDPEIYVKAMALLGVAPTETLVVEDNEHGIAAARAAGTHLMIVEEVTDVTLDNITRHLKLAEASS
jgi:HAD superfamily hydrolase (TIGR01509 family)